MENEMKTVTFTEVGVTSGAAYAEVRDKLETLGLLVTRFLSDKLVVVIGDIRVYEFEMEVQVLR